MLYSAFYTLISHKSSRMRDEMWSLPVKETDRLSCDSVLNNKEGVENYREREREREREMFNVLVLLCGKTL